MGSKIRLKESLYIVQESESVYHTVFTATRKTQKWEVNPLTKEIIELLKSPIEYRQILSQIGQKYSAGEVHACINALIAKGLATTVSNDKDDRLSKQRLYFREFFPDSSQADAFQDKLSRTKIAVFGAGGIGSWIINGLGQIGIGEIRICDPDIVSITNLNRQLHYTLRDVGRKKVDVLKERLPDFNIQPHYSWVRRGENLENIINDCNFIVNCTDSPSVAETTAIIDGFARKASTPYMVCGGYNLHLGMVGPIIVPGKTACFNCFLDYQKENDPFKNMTLVKQVEDSGNLSPIAGTIGNMHVMEIMKYLMGHPKSNLNRFAEIDLMNMVIEWREFGKRQGCKNCRD